jgi:hypothetical protein
MQKYTFVQREWKLEKGGYYKKTQERHQRSTSRKDEVEEEREDI